MKTTIRIDSLYKIWVAFNVYLNKIDSETAEISKWKNFEFCTAAAAQNSNLKNNR